MRVDHMGLTEAYGPAFERLLGQISDDLWSGVPPNKVQKRMLEEVEKLEYNPMKGEMLAACYAWFDVVSQNVPSAPEQLVLK